MDWRFTGLGPPLTRRGSRPRQSVELGKRTAQMTSDPLIHIWMALGHPADEYEDWAMYKAPELIPVLLAEEIDGMRRRLKIADDEVTLLQDTLDDMRWFRGLW